MDKDQPLIFGEVLFDCFPDGREVLGGAPFNVAWNLQALGLEPIFISRVGADSLGKKIREKMDSWGMDTTFLQLDMKLPTGRVDISLTDGEPRFAIFPNQAYDQISSLVPELKAPPPFLYHGSLALRDANNRVCLNDLKTATSSPVFLDVNLRTPWWNREDVLTLIAGATWLKLNDEECSILFPEEPDLHSCCTMLLDRYELSGVLLTMGNKGAMAFTPGASPCTIEPSRDIVVVDTVGAGDAFSSVLLLGLVRDWPLETVLTRAQDFASAIVGQRGATVQDIQFYQSFKDKWS